MAENKQGPAVTPNKLAMSRALGAAFLNHQVEQLEKSVSNGPSSGNWRSRRQGQPNNLTQVPPNASKRNTAPSGNKMPARKHTEETLQVSRNDRGPARDRNGNRDRGHQPDLHSRRRSSDEEKDEKDADIIVVDASVLVHALYQVKKWCRDGREEIIIVPLEALNTLDLLKKGTSPLAQRARAASRILEAQVGTNPRIRVQQDDAFVLWDKIAFRDAPQGSDNDNNHSGIPFGVSPEWVRRTICCARWEVDNAGISSSPPGVGIESGDPPVIPKVALAVLSSSPDLSPRFLSLKLTDNGSEAPLNPVPLPAPSHPHTNKFEPRSSGTLVAHWATRASISMLEIDPTSAGRGPEDEERSKRTHLHATPHGPKGRRSSTASDSISKVGLVERPPAVMAMMEMVSQPSKVVRVLARGEKLDPDP